MENLSAHELRELTDNAEVEGFNYYLYDDTPENDLVTKWATAPEPMLMARIIVGIKE